jgi:hypothetical protein
MYTESMYTDTPAYLYTHYSYTRYTSTRIPQERKTSLLRRRLLNCRGGETFAHECRTRLSHLSDGSAGPRRPSVGIGTWSHAGRRTVRRHGLVAGLHRASPSTSLDKSAGAGAIDLSISHAPVGRTPRVASGAEYSIPARPPPRDRRAVLPTLETQALLRLPWPVGHERVFVRERLPRPQRKGRSSAHGRARAAHR